MKNIIELFRRDISRVSRNVIALVVVMGVTVVPCLYAWFNIDASWDPYGNTDELKVAVASVDEGYTGELIPIDINIGEKALSALRENEDLDWIFTTKDEAIEGTESGKYYAAIVIPENFSSSLMSVFSDNIESPTLTYYYNAKENAIAPKVTEKGASSIQTQINEVFIETVSDAMILAMDTLSNTADKTGADAILDKLTANFESIASDLAAAGGTLQAFSQMTESSRQLLESTSSLLEQSQSASDDNAALLSDAQTSVDGIKEILTAATDSVNRALSDGKSYYDQIRTSTNDIYTSAAATATDESNALLGLSQSVSSVIDSYTSIRDSVADIGSAFPAFSNVTDELVSRLNASIERQADLKEHLDNASQSLIDGSKTAGEDIAQLDGIIQSGIDSTSDVQSYFETDVMPKFDSISDSLSEISAETASVLRSLDSGISDIAGLSKEASGSLSSLCDVLNESSSLMSSASQKLSDMINNMDSIRDSNDYTRLQSILSGNTDALSVFLAAPVTLNTVRIFPVDNYGSAMTPFYSTLALWVGGTILVAMLKVNVSDKCIAGMKNVKPYQLYFGRWLTFVIISFLQSTLICLGDLLYLGVQCEHPLLFMLAGWISGFVYVNITYSLTVSFGDIGKAIAVILMVIQVAGSGGTFPIEVAPEIFQKVYPLLPFVHSMNAMREAIAGIYGSVYSQSLLKLGLFFIASLVLGLFLRKPIIRLNSAVNNKLESTRLF